MSEFLSKIPFRVIFAWLVLIFILYNFFSVEPVDVMSSSVTMSPVRLVDAVVFIAMGAMVEDPMVDYSIASVRKLGKWKGDIYLITDNPQCFASSVEEFKITTIKVPKVNSIIEIKALKPKLMSYMPENVNGVLYIDVDILITKNLMSFFQDLGNIVHQQQLTGMLSGRDEQVVTKTLIEQKSPHIRRALGNATIPSVPAVKEAAAVPTAAKPHPVPATAAVAAVPFDFGAFPDAKGHYVGWCSGCEKWHSGVMWLRRGQGETCLQAWREILLSGCTVYHDHNMYFNVSLGKYDTDQQSLDFAEKNGSCRHGLTMPTRHLLFAKDYIAMALTSGQTFIHLTAAGRKEDTDYFYREFVIPGIRKSLHPPLNPNSLNHRKKCLPASV